MNFLGYTSTSKLNEKQELVDKLLDANHKFHEANGTLKSQVAKLKEQRTQAQRQIGELTDVKNLQVVEIKRLKQELESLRKAWFKINKDIEEKSKMMSLKNDELVKFIEDNKKLRKTNEELVLTKRKFAESLDEADQKIEELTEDLQKTNDRYDAFVTVSGTNFANHFERVLKKRKVPELTLE